MIFQNKMAKITNKQDEIYIYKSIDKISKFKIK